MPEATSGPNIVCVRDRAGCNRFLRQLNLYAALVVDVMQKSSFMQHAAQGYPLRGRLAYRNGNNPRLRVTFGSARPLRSSCRRLFRSLNPSRYPQG
jgi:hypothetical protein